MRGEYLLKIYTDFSFTSSEVSIWCPLLTFMKTHRETHKHTKQNKTNLKERPSKICTQFPFAFYFEACLYPVSIFYHCHKYDAQKGLRGKACSKSQGGTGKCGRSLKEKPWECCLQNNFIWLDQPAFLHSPGLLRHATTHSGVGSPAATSNQETAPSDMPTGPSHGGGSWTEVSFLMCQVDNQGESPQPDSCSMYYLPDFTSALLDGSTSLWTVLLPTVTWSLTFLHNLFSPSLNLLGKLCQLI